MKDVRSFLRYILPGLVFSIWLLISLLISDTDKTICFLKEVNEKNIIGVIAATFLSSGALGYIFSVVYWVLYWLKPFLKINDIAIDHRPFLKGLTEMRKIKIVDIYGERMEMDELDNISKREAWVIFSQHWWTSRVRNGADKDKFISIDRIADVTHGIGTALISILLAFISWLVIHFGHLKSEPNIYKGLVFLLQIPLILAFWKNYRVTHQSLQSLLNSSFANMVEAQFEEKGSEIKIYYSE